VFDLAWPSGLQEELRQPVAVLLNEGDHPACRRGGIPVFLGSTEAPHLQASPAIDLR
jgi:hypothetical protein